MDFRLIDVAVAVAQAAALAGCEATPTSRVATAQGAGSRVDWVP
jgi:hypothetical protein